MNRESEIVTVEAHNLDVMSMYNSIYMWRKGLEDYSGIYLYATGEFYLTCILDETEGKFIPLGKTGYTLKGDVLVNGYCFISCKNWEQLFGSATVEELANEYNISYESATDNTYFSDDETVIYHYLPSEHKTITRQGKVFGRGYFFSTRALGLILNDGIEELLKWEWELE